jgi:ribosome-associated protein
MPRPLLIRQGVHVPASALTVSAARAAGPGGQNVNKVASKVELRIGLEGVVGLDAGARQRLRILAGRRVVTGDVLVVTSQRTRDQARNLEDAREKVRSLIIRALDAPRVRQATRPSAAAKRRRLEGKRARARLKRDRGQARTLKVVDRE